MSITEEKIKLAEAIRIQCAEAAKEGFNEASTRGLCSEGAIEAAIGAIQSLNLNKVIKELEK